jgi:hypothetical protein
MLAVRYGVCRFSTAQQAPDSGTAAAMPVLHVEDLARAIAAYMRPSLPLSVDLW